MSSLHQAFQDGVIHINVSEGNSIEMNEAEVNSNVLDVAMLQQFKLKAGLKHFGKKGEEAVASELTQMHAMETYVPVDPESMTPQHKLEALNSQIFLIKNAMGVSNRACATMVVNRSAVLAIRKRIMLLLLYHWRE